MELKRDRPCAGMMAEAVPKPRRLPVWKVMVDCLDMVMQKGSCSSCQGLMKEDGGNGHLESLRPPKLLWAPQRGGVGGWLPLMAFPRHLPALNSHQPPDGNDGEKKSSGLVPGHPSLPHMETPF